MLWERMRQEIDSWSKPFSSPTDNAYGNENKNDDAAENATDDG